MHDTAEPVPARSFFRRLLHSLKRILLTLVLLLLVCAILAGIYEFKTFRLQAQAFARIAQGFSYRVDSSASDAIAFPRTGPYDIRLGYTRIPEWISALHANGFVVDRQARWSPSLLHYTGLGIFPVYKEKTQAGLRIYDRQKREIVQSAFPQRVYPNFQSIPPLAVKMLLFIENRTLLDETPPYRNPAIEYERLFKAVVDAAINVFDPSHKVVGGSTLATQIEKFRHSPEGKTGSAGEKLRQILSASLRAYLDGENTGNIRKHIVLDYMNAIPLSAARGSGEVSGLGDGLWAWYNMDFDQVNRLLATAEKPVLPPDEIRAAGVAVRAVLSLFLSQRRPSYYLLQKPQALRALTDSHLRLLYSQGILSPAIYASALQAPLVLVPQTNLQHSFDAVQRKTAAIVRARLLGDLKVASTYALDRLDLTVQTTLDKKLQQAITAKLNRMQDPEYVRASGFIAPHMLETGDPRKVIYSFSLFEHTPQGNALRVQTNTYEGPFNIDEQMKLDLGSSAKLRALVHYLHIITQLHEAYAGRPKPALAEISRKEILDPLSRWALDYLLRTPQPGLQAMLDAAMQRTYPASPHEAFFTGGGVHRFANFNKEDNAKTMSVSLAFRHSVNLVFIRLMRDITNYHIYKRYGITPRNVERLEESEKLRLLRAFADKEGLTFLRAFYKKYQGKSPQEAKALLLSEIYPVPGRLAAALRYLEPGGTLEGFSAGLSPYLPESRLTGPFLGKLYEQYAPGKFPLADIGFLAHVHPLELWVVRYLQSKPGAAFPEIIAQSVNERQEVYRWLFKTKSPRKQYIRIRTIVELETYQDILEFWKKLGYPFDYLVPSYATAIGSSGDRPGALAELTGIILNDGVRYPSIRNVSFHFAKATPYETRLIRQTALGEQVIRPEVARTVKQALEDVVQQGTAIRIKDKAVLTDGSLTAVGGKTGTGDHRYKRFGPGGVLLGSTVMNRAAVFVFFLGDRYFGSITAYVPGKQAQNYSFSSSLTVAVLQTLLPELLPLFEGPPDDAAAAPSTAATAPPRASGPAALPGQAAWPGRSAGHPGQDQALIAP